MVKLLSSKQTKQSLKYQLHQRIGTIVQQKWLSKLLGYAFVVEYKKGSENVVADALSRRGEVSELVATSLQDNQDSVGDQADSDLGNAVADFPNSTSTTTDRP